MDGTSEKILQRHICIGILAHVDAGKTTLSEMLLYLTGQIRTLGRVDHKDAFLDNFALERERGITIFSKQAELVYEDLEITLLDTPGHMDFSAEMERTLQVLDAAILVISGADGVQSHTKTLWRLLRHYGIPTFLFVNKMDLGRLTQEELMKEFHQRLHGGCICFDLFSDRKEEFYEEIALCREDVLDSYLESGTIPDETIRELIQKEKLFPCYFGSALKGEGVEELLKGLKQFVPEKSYPEEFGARVFKITRDSQGNRLTHLKVTGGALRVKQPLGEEKADQIRIYSGSKFEICEEVPAGIVCAVTGLKQSQAGQGLGIEENTETALLEPVLSYCLRIPQEISPQEALKQLRQLEEEDPMLHLLWDETLKEMQVQIMGQIQLEVLSGSIAERFGWIPEFSEGSILYKETIEEPVLGVGHYEPLRHYAEVQLLMEPGEPGSGLQFETVCSEDVLDRNWQRLILTHLGECEHPGVLTGGPITDMKITLVAGRAHLKHTEGGDFRQATYRAVRQGLKKAKSLLLEPMYQFTLEIPAEAIGRAMTDIERRFGRFDAPEINGETARLEGSGPVAAFQDYGMEVAAYTSGQGQFFCALQGYGPCHNTEEVLAQCRYDSEIDLSRPTGSVFCSHGAGFVVPWDQVDDYKHLDVDLEQVTKVLTGKSYYSHGDCGKMIGAEETADNTQGILNYPKNSGGKTVEEQMAEMDPFVAQEELEAIFARTFGSTGQRTRPGSSFGYERTEKKPVGLSKPRKKKAGKEYLLVDGYNIIFAWDELKELAKDDLHSARMRLMDILANYQGYRKCTLILVFDAYKVKGNPGSMEQYHNIYVVYTKEAETADMYIEKTTHEIAREHQVTVATSDGLEQMIVIGSGATRLSANGLYEEVKRVEAAIREQLE